MKKIESRCAYQIDMYIGVHGMDGLMWSVGLGPTNGDEYIFVECIHKDATLLSSQSVK